MSDSNFVAVGEFRHASSTRNSVGNDTYRYRCIVQYKSTLYGDCEDVLDVDIDVGGFEPRVMLDVSNSSNVITPASHHKDFFIGKYKSTKISFKTAQSELFIEDKSSKMGHYKVSIKEL